MRASLSFLTLLVAAAALRVNAQEQPPAPPPCNPTDAQWVCGQQTPEDLVALPGGEWVISSAYQGTGGMNLINVSARRSVVVFPGPAVKQQPDKKVYPDCPGPPAPETRRPIYAR